MEKGVIDIEGMEFYAFHGCYREEQIVGNRFLVDLQFTTDIEAAMSSDSITDTVSYLTVYKIIAREMKITSHILEHVAKRILDAIYYEFGTSISNVKIKVSKCNPPLGGYVNKVSVTAQR